MEDQMSIQELCDKLDDQARYISFLEHETMTAKAESCLKSQEIEVLKKQLANLEKMHEDTKNCEQMETFYSQVVNPLRDAFDDFIDEVFEKLKGKPEKENG